MQRITYTNKKNHPKMDCLNILVQPANASPPKVTGTTPMTTTVAPNNGPFNCQFSTGFCGWTQSTTDDFDWTRKQGSTQSAGTGPPSDHTGGQYQACVILYLKAGSLGYSPRLKCHLNNVI